jgi:hypothetical protein
MTTSRALLSRSSAASIAEVWGMIHGSSCARRWEEPAGDGSGSSTVDYTVQSSLTCGTGPMHQRAGVDCRGSHSPVGWRGVGEAAVKAERGVMGSRPACPAARPLMAWQSLPLASPPGKAHRHWEQAWWRRPATRLPVSYAEVSIRNVISGSLDRETDPIRALIGGACRVWQWVPSRPATQ